MEKERSDETIAVAQSAARLLARPIAATWFATAAHFCLVAHSIAAVASNANGRRLAFREGAAAVAAAVAVAIVIAVVVVVVVAVVVAVAGHRSRCGRFEVAYSQATVTRPTDCS